MPHYLPQSTSSPESQLEQGTQWQRLMQRTGLMLKTNPVALAGKCAGPLNMRIFHAYLPQSSSEECHVKPRRLYRFERR